MRLELLALLLELPHLLLELVADVVDGALDGRRRGHVLGRGPDHEVVEPRVDLAGERVEVRDRLDLVAEERDPVRRLRVGGLHLDDVALDAEAAAGEDRVVARVLALDQHPQRVVPVDRLADVEDQDPPAPLLRRAEAVDARDRRDDDHVAAGEEGGGRREAQSRDVVVPGRVLLDVEVGLRDVRLGLVVVVVGDEVLDRVVGEELAELVAELRGQRLVVGDHERRPADLLDDPGHRRRLAGAGRAQERLVALSGRDRRRQRLDRLRLVAGRPVLVRRPERGHAGTRYRPAPRPTSAARVGAPGDETRAGLLSALRTAAQAWPPAADRMPAGLLRPVLYPHGPRHGGRRRFVPSSSASIRSSKGCRPFDGQVLMKRVCRRSGG